MYVPTAMVSPLITFKVDFFLNKALTWYYCEVLQKRQVNFFQWTSVSQFPKQRVTSKYSEYILRKKVTAWRMPEMHVCSRTAHSCRCTGLLLLIYFLKSSLRNAFFPHPHLCRRPTSIHGFFYLPVSETAFQWDTTGVK